MSSLVTVGRWSCDAQVLFRLLKNTPEKVAFVKIDSIQLRWNHFQTGVLELSLITTECKRAATTTAYVMLGCCSAWSAPHHLAFQLCSALAYWEIATIVYNITSRQKATTPLNTRGEIILFLMLVHIYCSKNTSILEHHFSIFFFQSAIMMWSYCPGGIFQ